MADLLGLLGEKGERVLAELNNIADPRQPEALGERGHVGILTTIQHLQGRAYSKPRQRVKDCTRTGAIDKIIQSLYHNE